MGAVTETFRLALLTRRAAGERIYQIAHAAQVRPNELSGIAAGSISVRRGDARVLRVAAYLGLTPDDCFTERDAPIARRSGAGA